MPTHNPAHLPCQASNPNHYLKSHIQRYRQTPDDTSVVEVTLTDTSPQDGIKNIRRAEYTTMKSNDASDIESQDGSEVNTNVDPFTTNDIGNVQAARPRLGFNGFSAINKHLNGNEFVRNHGNHSTPASAKASCPVGDLQATTPLPQPTRLNRSEAYGRALGAASPALMSNAAHPPSVLGSVLLDERKHPNDQSSINSSNSLTADIQAFQQKRNILPDLNRFATAEYIASVIASSPSHTRSDGLPVTRPFSLSAPPYKDEDIPIPQPYNTEYPHPLTSYASPQVNPYSIEKSGYSQLLDHLVRNNLPLAMGSRLYDCGFRDLESSVYLPFSFAVSQGNGIPESLWSKLENSTSNSNRLPVGVAGVSPFARTSHSATMGEVPPRFAQAQVALDYGMLTPPESSTETDYFSTSLRTIPSDYDPTPRPSPEYYRSLKHASSLGRIRSSDRIWSSEASQIAPHHSPISRQEKSISDLRSRDYAQAGDDGNSPFYKTELCAIWQQIGACKYGDRCQYAHGKEELRLPRHLREALRSSATTGQFQNTFETFDGVAYPSPAKPISLRSQPRVKPIDTQLDSLQIRRASDSPQQMSALSMTDITHNHPSKSRQQQSFSIPAPIGAERPISRHVSGRNTPSAKQSISSSEKWEDMPPFNLADSSYSLVSPVESGSTQIRSQPSTMSLSLSTSSSSDYSLFSQYTEESPRTSFLPNQGDITLTKNDFGYGKQRDPNNGQSIW
ncbi:uncharacterized protein I303_106809 [Kwoniella dejecticola CBS 10117]|uniref:C3H1-type domain-containing protein n=1 Tax=Kwoniella dejecticola CBS 10117 TaxID=1296121 RepID=A0A1A5ZTL9_9TREE|nr:uncharacterized protein I303_08548 [Kwoniella dejecticola CBS 10117]OBR81164.1 hypothetical protein I303_08548 [Kwoniella dejecticola CBS 10117]